MSDKNVLQELLEEFIQKASALVGKKEVPVIKSVETEERKALFVVLEPDTVDAHGDTYSAKEVEKAFRSFTVHCNKANLMHRIELQDADITQSYIAPTDFQLETPTGTQEIKKGTWLQEWYFPETEVGNELWTGVKDGTYDGLSIRAMAIEEKLE